MSDRFIHLMKLGIGRYPAVDVDVDMKVLEDVCKYYFEKQEAIAYITGSNVKADEAIDELNAIYISDLSEDDHYLSLLLVRGDPGRAIPGFVNPKTRTVTTISSDDPESVRGASCHLIISKKSIATGNDQGRHRMAMEQATGIGRVLARDFLAKLMAKYAEEKPEEFTALKKNVKKGAKAVEILYRPTVRFHPQKNGSLKEDLEDGKIGGFKLVRGKTEFQGEADEPKIKKLDVQLHARIIPTEDFSKVKSLVDNVQQALENINFEDLKLELIDDEGAPVTGTGTLNLDNLDEADMRYCRKLRIMDVAENDTPEVYEKIYKPISEFSRKVIANDNHWK